MLLNSDCHHTGKDGNQCLFSPQAMMMIVVGGSEPWCSVQIGRLKKLGFDVSQE